MIIGYVYQEELFCPECTVKAVSRALWEYRDLEAKKGSQIPSLLVVPGQQAKHAERLLQYVADRSGVDRDGENASDIFPVPLTDSVVGEGPFECVQCGFVIVDDEGNIAKELMT